MQIMDVGREGNSRMYKDPTQEIRRIGGHLFVFSRLPPFLARSPGFRFCSALS
jgi:hypothetical protein